MAHQPCLPVSRRRKRDDNSIGASFNDIQSMDATDYLGRVVNEANRLPSVFVSTNTGAGESRRKDHVPIEGSAASLLYLTSDRVSIQSPPTAAHIPEGGTAWTDRTLETFSRLRLYLDQCKDQGVGGKETDRIIVPPLRDRPSWHIFLVGKDEARGNSGSFFDDADDEDETSSKANEELEPWEVTLLPEGYSPTVSLLLQMDQVMVRRVLGNLVHYVREGWSAACPQRAAWIYGLLARLERPLHRDDAAMLYGLLKKLAQERSNNKAASKQERLHLARLNVLIAIVGIYFEQGGGFANVMAVK
jgi:survival of motor neuron protein-interacting protein 1